MQAKVREATSNEDSGPTMGQLEEIARASFHPYTALPTPLPSNVAVEVNSPTLFILSTND